MNPESVREAAVLSGGPFWHLYTSGETMEIIFAGTGDFLFGITLLGICAAAFPRCRILTFALMNNHLHIVLAGPEADIPKFFELFKRRLQRYVSICGRDCSLRRFDAEFFRIPDLQALRNEIVYVNRNGFVVHPECTPFSYWWSAGIFFFNPMAELLPSIPFASLTFRQRREMCHCRDVALPEKYRVFPGFPMDKDGSVAPLLLPTSFCDIQEAENYFRDAHQYFQRLGKDHESHAEVARRLGDKVFLTDEEMYRVACSICAKEHGFPRPGVLSPAQKMDLARKMHFEYNASNKQIRRIVMLPQELVDELFPAKRFPSSKQ